MQALIITAHGSRRKQSNLEFLTLVESLKLFLPDVIVQGAFLESTKPLLKDVLETLVEEGNTELSVYPYFLSSGIHVEHDIPAIINSVTKNNSKCTIQQLPYVGAYAGMSELILSQVSGLK